MDTAQAFTVALVILVGAILVFGMGYFGGRMLGYRLGLEKGKTLSGRVEHLKGMSDGYVMSLHHTPAQRDEYMNNVLLRTGAITAQQLQDERQRRFRMRMEA